MSLRGAVFLVLLLASVVLAALVSQRYAFQVDLSAAGIHSLSEDADRSLSAIGSGLEILAFEPDRPVQRANLEHRLAPYLAHPSGPRMRYIDPEREPVRAREHQVRQVGELHLRLGTRQEVVHPVRAGAIDQALNRLALSGQRWVVSLSGHGEAAIDDAPDGLARLADHLEALGYRLLSIDPRQVDRIPDNTAVLLIAGPQQAYPAAVTTMIRAYLAQGGRVLWLIGAAGAPTPGDGFGVDLLPGTVIDAAAARYGLDRPENAIVSEWPPALLRQTRTGHAALHRARAFDSRPAEGWRQVASLRSSAMSWNETGPLSGRIRRDPEQGEQQGPLVVGAAFESLQAGAQAKLVLLGSAQLLGNAQLGVADNLGLALGLVRWLTDNADLGSDTGGADLDIRWSPAVAGGLAIALMGGLPVAYVLAGLWLRRRRRMA